MKIKILKLPGERLYRFTVHGDPVGYYAKGARPDWKRYNKYVEYNKNVQLVAMANGVNFPLEASKENNLFIATYAYFKNGIHSDPGNVQKGICDALFYGAKGSGDKYTGGYFAPPMYDKADPRVEIFIYKWE